MKLETAMDKVFKAGDFHNRNSFEKVMERRYGIYFIDE